MTRFFIFILNPSGRRRLVHVAFSQEDADYWMDWMIFFGDVPQMQPDHISLGVAPQ